MKVHFNLNASANFNTGMTVYSTQIIKRIVEKGIYDCEGGVNFNIKNREYLKNLSIPIQVSYLPYRFMFKGKDKRLLSYDRMMNCKADCFVFWGNVMPKMKVKGKVITVVHDMIPVQTASWNAELFRENVSYALENSDCIVTVSQNAKDCIIKELGFGAEKIKIVFNGVDKSLFSTNLGNTVEEKIRKRYGLPNKYLLYLGGTMRHKNIINMIEAYAGLPEKVRREYKFVISNTADYLVDYAKKTEAGKDIYFLSGVAEEDKAGLYKMAELMLFVSKYEGFGIPVIEAMAAGIPVITSSVSSLPEVAGDAAKQVNPDDVAEISRTIEEVLENPELKRDMVLKGFKNAGKFSWEKSAEDFMGIINFLCRE